LGITSSSDTKEGEPKGIEVCDERQEKRMDGSKGKSTVDNRLAALRAKLEQDAPQPKHLRTVQGVGCKFAL
jgi:DNA-binding response OmpR family regulator